MIKKNKYANRSKTSEKKIRKIVKYFSMDLEVVKIAELTNLNQNTVTKYMEAIRAYEREAEMRQDNNSV